MNRAGLSGAGAVLVLLALGAPGGLAQTDQPDGSSEAVAFFMSLDPGAGDREEILEGLEALLGEAESRWETLRDYTAKFVREERVQTHLAHEETWFTKFRKPHRIYMKCERSRGGRRGEEMIYERDRHDGRMVICPPAWLSIIARPLRYEVPRAGLITRYAETEYYLGAIQSRFIACFRRGLEGGEVRAAFLGVESDHGRPRLVLDLWFPAADVRGEPYPWRHVRIQVDVRSRLLVGFSAWSFGEVESGDGEGTLREYLEERYEFSRLKIDAGLEASDFSVGNRDYGFRNSR